MQPALQTCRPCRRREGGNMHKHISDLQRRFKPADPAEGEKAMCTNLQPCNRCPADLKTLQAEKGSRHSEGPHELCASTYITPTVGLGRQYVGLLRDLGFPCRGSSSTIYFTAPTNQLRTNYTQTCKGQYRFTAPTDANYTEITAPTDANYTERWYGSMPTTSPKECMPVHDCNMMNCKDNHNSTALTTHQSTCRRGPQKLGKNY